jgi:hypothetical protein
MKTTFNLTWHGQEYSRRLHTELKRAVQQSALRVQRKAKELLNTSGKGVVNKTGLNRPGKGSSKMTQTQKNQQIATKGRQLISGLKTVTSKKTGASLTFSGSYRGVDRIYWYGPPENRWVQSSPPGSPPHKQHGTLQRSIAFQITHSGLRAKVGPQNTLIYGRIQELGGRGLIRLPPRPYLRPAFESQQQAILFQFALAIQKAGQQKP